MVLDLLGPALLVIALLYVMRRMERWLHQHIFKVGWLFTKDLRTTTVIYYLFFLPGVVLYEVVVWLVAGIVDVAAERNIRWPEEQQMADLKLNFIKIPKNISVVKQTIIFTAPVLVGIVLVWVISSQVLNFDDFIATLTVTGWEGLPPALETLLSTPDFFLWLYILFTISNTMIPSDIKNLSGWRPIIIVSVISFVLLYVIGIGETLLVNALATPLNNAVSILATAFITVISINIFMTAVLGTVEAIYERITGDSATFQNGKLVAVRREELIEQRNQQRQKEQQRLEKQTARKKMGPPSIYKLPLPIIGPPGKTSFVTSSTEDDDAPKPPPLPQGNTGRAGPSVIMGNAVAKSESIDEDE